MISLTVIIVSFNTSDLLRDCLTSLFKAAEADGLSADTEVLVVDNASTDGSEEMVKKEFPQVTVIKNPTNTGFAQANNQGIQKAKGEYVLLLNSDTKMKTGSLAGMVECIKKDYRIGVVGGKLLNADGTIQQNAGYFPHLLQVICWMWFIDDVPGVSTIVHPYHIESKHWYRTEHDVDWVSGACMLVHKSCIKEIGGFDEKIFMYGEEVEWCFRIKRNGFRVIYTPRAETYHLKGASSAGAHAGIVDEFRTLLYFYRKHKPSWQLPVLRFVLLSGAWLRIGIFGIIGRYRGRGTHYAKAIEMVRR